jgi:hypothetical protein
VGERVRLSHTVITLPKQSDFTLPKQSNFEIFRGLHPLTLSFGGYVYLHRLAGGKAMEDVAEVGQGCGVAYQRFDLDDAVV